MKRSYTHLILRGFMLILAGVAVFKAGPVQAQVNRYIQQGNKFYEQQDYKAAAADYSRALAKDPNNLTSLFNLGNSLYQQKQYDSSRKVMAATAQKVIDKNSKAAVNYNIGNSYMSQQKWEDAVNYYKQTLRQNPQDADAKYNLSYAQQMLKKEQQQNKDNKDKQNKDQQDKLKKEKGVPVKMQKDW